MNKCEAAHDHAYEQVPSARRTRSSRWCHSDGPFQVLVKYHDGIGNHTGDSIVVNTARGFLDLWPKI